MSVSAVYRFTAFAEADQLIEVYQLKLLLEKTDVLVQCVGIAAKYIGIVIGLIRVTNSVVVETVHTRRQRPPVESRPYLLYGFLYHV